MKGLGNQLVIGAPAIAGQVLTTGGSASIAAAAWGAAAIPIVGAIVAGATLALAAIFARKGPRQKIATTQIVEQVEPLLAQNRDGYLAGPRTQSSQAQALANFDAGWQYIRENCGLAEMGEPGRRCISERDRGGRFDFFRMYRDPIANDAAIPDPLIPGLPSIEELFGYSSTANVPWLPAALGAGLVVAGLFAARGDA